MPFDPTLPQENTLIDAVQMRGQLNGLKDLIDAGAISGVVIDEVTSLPPGTPATVSASMIGSVLHLSFGLPAGNDGPEGPQGNDGNPGEVTTAALNAAIAGTARNPAGVATLDTPYGDPASEELRGKLNELIGATFRAPT